MESNRSVSIIIGSILILISVTIWALTFAGPQGPANYDVEIGGVYYIEEIIPQASIGDLAHIEYTRLVEVPPEQLNRPPIESPFWRFWDSWGFPLSLFAFFPTFAVGVSRLMPALFKTEG